MSWGDYTCCSSQLIWAHLNWWPHFILTECTAVISRSHGQLGRALWGDPVLRGCDWSLRCTQLRWSEVRWDKVRSDEWYENSFTVENLENWPAYSGTFWLIGRYARVLAPPCVWQDHIVGQFRVHFCSPRVKQHVTFTTATTTTTAVYFDHWQQRNSTCIVYIYAINNVRTHSELE